MFNYYKSLVKKSVYEKKNTLASFNKNRTVLYEHVLYKNLEHAKNRLTFS